MGRRIFYHTMMRVMVWHMRWMTRYLGFIARPIVRLYGKTEVIACGLREENGSVSIVYTPLPGHHAHHVVLKEDGAWKQTPFSALKNFSGSVVSRIGIPGAENGAVYKVKGKTARGKILSSPQLFIKETTAREAGFLSARTEHGGEILFSWRPAEAFDPMIYFLIIENGRGETLAAAYTRETFFRYPHIKTASYSVGPNPPPSPTGGGSYAAKLLLVDYDGWVSHLAEVYQT